MPIWGVDEIRTYLACYLGIQRQASKPFPGTSFHTSDKTSPPPDLRIERTPEHGFFGHPPFSRTIVQRPQTITPSSALVKSRNAQNPVLTPTVVIRLLRLFLAKLTETRRPLRNLLRFEVSERTASSAVPSKDVLEYFWACSHRPIVSVGSSWENSNCQGQKTREGVHVSQ